MRPEKPCPAESIDLFKSQRRNLCMESAVIRTSIDPHRNLHRRRQEAEARGDPPHCVTQSHYVTHRTAKCDRE